jgi:hypothetical protein
VLITLVSIHPYPSPQSVPLANAFLKAYAAQSPVAINLIDFFLGDDPVACATRLADMHPDAVGFSMYVWNRELCCEIAAEIRRKYPTAQLFCGGPEVTADPASVAGSNIFDFVIVGEGEIPFLSLCNNLTAGRDYLEIPGILGKGSTSLAPPPPLADLDLIPSPYLTGIINTHDNPGILWQLSRGCSFTCDFCFDSRGINGVRHFSLERVESELQYFARNGVSQVFVLDSTFNLDAKRAKKLLRMIKKIAPGIHFHFEIRNEFIDREMADLFAHISCSLQIGLQSADREVLKQVGRSFNKKDFTSKVMLLNESGAVFGFDLIYGLPGDTLDGFCDSLNYALSLYPNHLDIFPLAVLPGTRLAERGSVLNMQWDTLPPYLLKETDRFSLADMASAAELATAADIFYTRGKAVAWFNSVVAVLGLKPSDLLNKFIIWLINRKGRTTKEADFSDGEIWEMQQQFLGHLFNDKKLKRFLPLVLDLVNFHHQYAAALLSEARPVSLPPAQNRNTRYKLDPSARIVNFTYDIDELLEYGEPHIRRMFESLAQSGSQAVIYCTNGAVCTESLAAPYVHILEQIRFNRNHNSGSMLTNDETNEFLEFALSEGIIVTA